MPLTGCDTIDENQEFPLHRLFERDDSTIPSSYQCIHKNMTVEHTMLDDRQQEEPEKHSGIRHSFNTFSHPNEMETKEQHLGM